MKAPLAGGTPVTLAPEQTTAPYGMVTDTTGVYLATGQSVLVVPIDGGEIFTVTTEQALGPLAVDATSIYWVDFTGAILKLTPK
jgi:hypothetical protein